MPPGIVADLTVRKATASMSQLESPHENASQDSTWSSAPELRKKVRELAHRGHRTLEAPRQCPECPEDLGEDPRDLREQVAKLHRRIHQRCLGGLVAWINALK